jgi:hypothetical protein
MEYKAFARGDIVADTGSVTKKRKKTKTSLAHASTKSKRVPTVVGLDSRLSLAAEEVADIARCMTNPRKPTATLLQGAALLRKHYKNR